jgi:hypothetical protein
MNLSPPRRDATRRTIGPAPWANASEAEPIPTVGPAHTQPHLIGCLDDLEHRIPPQHLEHPIDERPIVTEVPSGSPSPFSGVGIVGSTQNVL